MRDEKIPTKADEYAAKGYSNSSIGVETDAVGNGVMTWCSRLAVTNSTQFPNATPTLACKQNTNIICWNRTFSDEGWEDDGSVGVDMDAAGNGVTTWCS